MTRAIAAAFALFALVALGTFAQVQPAQADVMSCMADCIKSEGKDEKDTCKMRCANVPPGNGAQQVDCGKQYKTCLAGCAANDKDCRKPCKDQLMSCK
ncbi:MAG: hypothetical protein ACPGNT_05715 [Rhodospirillales bacterium]